MKKGEKKMLKRNKGITLIALVVTIIVLLILAGVTLSLVTGENGILKRATNAVDVNEKATAEEQADLLVAEIATKYYEEKYVDNKKVGEIDVYIQEELETEKETVTGGYKVIAEKEENEIIVRVLKNGKEISEGILKDGKVEWSNENMSGIKPEISADIVTEGYALEGSTIKIQVTVSITQGNVNIIAPENMEPIAKITDTDIKKVYEYTVNKNGNYTFTAEGDSGRKATTTVKVNQLIDKPRINVSNNIGTAVTVNVENDYPADANITYTYYLGTTVKATSIKDKSFTIDGLTEETEYTVKVAIKYNTTTLESDPLTITTISRNPTIQVSGDFEVTPLEYPLLTTKRVMNCSTTLENNDQLTVEILGSKELKNLSNITTYYTLDSGDTWNEYTDKFTITYTGDTTIKAKRVIGGEEVESEVIYYKGYTYDAEEACTGSPVIDDLAYDGKYETYAKLGNIGNITYYMMIDSECWNKYVSFYTICTGGFNSAAEYGYVKFGVLSNGVFEQSGSNISMAETTGITMHTLSTKSISIPSNVSCLGVTRGTSKSCNFRAYEIWYSEENLSGQIY